MHKISRYIERPRSWNIDFASSHNVAAAAYAALTTPFFGWADETPNSTSA